MTAHFLSFAPWFTKTICALHFRVGALRGGNCPILRHMAALQLLENGMTLPSRVPPEGIRAAGIGQRKGYRDRAHRGARPRPASHYGAAAALRVPVTAQPTLSQPPDLGHEAFPGYQ